MADWWHGHLATLHEARIACRDIDSNSCLPYLAQAVADADTLSAQAKYDQQSDAFQIQGYAGWVPICDASVVRDCFNGDSLPHLALAAPELTIHWDQTLFVSALDLCRGQGDAP